MAIHVGIDLGTSGVRAIAVDSGGMIHAQQREPLPPSRRTEGASEQNPEAWWQATTVVLQRLFSAIPDHGEVISITVDGTSSTLLLTDSGGRVLTAALMYDDCRAIEEAERISQIAPSESGAHGPTSSLAKLLWLLDRGVERIPRGTLALHQADWISNRLGGAFGQSDENNALKLGYDIIHRGWPDWMEALELPPGMLPAVSPPGTAYSILRADLADRLGLNTSRPIRIHCGTTDSIAATIAAGARVEGDAVTSLGTTLVLKLVSSTPLFSPRDGIYSHRLGSHWLISGASNAGAGVLLNHFSLEQIRQLSSKINPDEPTGLDYYPLPSRGERFPVADPLLMPRLTPRPKEDQIFLQGILEGLTRIEQLGYRKMGALGGPPLRRIITSGGGAVNRNWMALRQNLFHQELPDLQIDIATQTEAAYGAALLPVVSI